MIKRRSIVLSLIAGLVLCILLVQYFKRINIETQVVDSVTDIKTENEWVEKIETNLALQNKYDLMNLYTANVDSYESEVFMRVAVPKSLGLEEKFRLLMGKLGIYHFNIPIDEITFSKQDQKWIAKINLKEHPRNQSSNDVLDFKGENWAGQYFQGSAGSTITYAALVGTALQQEYTGEWIDGVEFFYNGKPIEFDHMYGISEIKWRK